MEEVKSFNGRSGAEGGALSRDVGDRPAPSHTADYGVIGGNAIVGL